MKKHKYDKVAHFVCDDNDLEDHSAMYITKGDDWYMTMAPVKEHTLGKVPIGYPQIRFRLSGSLQPEGLSHLVNMMHALGTEDYDRLSSITESFSKIVSELHYKQIKEKTLENNKKRIKEQGSTAHGSHCCLDHGCKYGEDEYCPVFLGLEKPCGCPASEQCVDIYGDFGEPGGIFPTDKEFEEMNENELYDKLYGYHDYDEEDDEENDMHSNYKPY